MTHSITALIARAAAVALALCAAPLAAHAQADASAIYVDKSADRDTQLVAKAKQEGTLTLYTSMAPSESGRLGQAFEKKYGIKVQVWRNLSEAVLQRPLTEASPKRHTLDVSETNSPEVEVTAREGVVAEFYSPYLSNLHDYAIAPHRKWVSDRVNLFVVGFNTQKVKREEIPPTYEGFTDPKWKGKLGVEATDQEWLGAIIKYWGEQRGMAFFQKLAEQKLDLRKGPLLLAPCVWGG